ncbi:hypothetical protein IAR50_004773 [Cryptococcus sp. DSM 104548]
MSAPTSALPLRPSASPKKPFNKPKRASAADYMTDIDVASSHNGQSPNASPIAAAGLAPIAPVATSSASSAFTTQSTTAQSQCPAVKTELATRMVDLMASVSAMGDEAYEAAFRSAFYEQPASSSTTPTTPITPTTPTTPTTRSSPGSPKRKRQLTDEGDKRASPYTPSPLLAARHAVLGRSVSEACSTAKGACIRRDPAKACNRCIDLRTSCVSAAGSTPVIRRRSPTPRCVPSLPSLYFPPPLPATLPVSSGCGKEDPADSLAVYLSQMGIASVDERKLEMAVAIVKGCHIGMAKA